MGLFLLRFWPVLLPLVAYSVWFNTVGRRARAAGKTIHFSDGPWYWIVLSSLLIAILCFLFLGSTTEGGKGRYVPPHLEGGQMVPGHVDPEP